MPKYISKEFIDGKWIYKYHENRYKARETIDYCKSKPLACNENNALQKGEEFIKAWQKDWNEHKEKSKSYLFDGNTVIVAVIDENGKEGISLQHFGYKKSGKKEKRTDLVVYERARLLPIAKEMLESKGKATINEVRESKYQTDYEIVGKAYFDGEFQKICVIVSKRKNTLTYLSLMKKAISEDTAFITDVFILESSKNGSFWANREGGGTLPQPSIIIPKSKNMSSNIKKSLTFSGHKLQGRIKLYGMNISIENRKGSYRSGVDSDGHKWRTYMNYAYGYIRGTVGTDGDHTDCYIGPDKKSNKVYIIHQNNPVTHKYDEDKCMLCFANAEEAKKAYMKQYDRPGFFGSMETMDIEQFKSFVFSKQGKRIHKSFDIVITDITEKNKQQKVEQLQKSLNAIAENKPFVIKHIPCDKSKKYCDVTLRITNFDKSKIEKAVHKMAFSLDTEVKSTIGEPFYYKSQEELTDRTVKELTEKTKDIYSFLIAYLGLPEIRIVSKANLKYEGKTLYNPETGLPMKQSEWDNFVKQLEKYLNRNYDGTGKKIVLSAETLGRMLNKLSKINSMSKLRKMKLSDLKYNQRNFDWISETAQNMQTSFPSVDRTQEARLQVAIDSAAMRVTNVTDNLRDSIQQIVIDGIKNKESKTKVSQNLFDKCVGFNRDLQRIADSEIQNNTNNAYVLEEVYNSKPNEKIYFKRYEILDNVTCKRCKKAYDKIALFSDVGLSNENISDPYADVAIWEGKTSGNYPMGIFHPYCRGCWIRYYPKNKYTQLAQQKIAELEKND